MPKLKVALVRGPILYKGGSVNSEATPAIAFAYISAFLKQKGYETIIIDGIGEGLNKTWAHFKPGFFCQGLTFNEIIERIPRDVDVIGFEPWEDILFDIMKFESVTSYLKEEMEMIVISEFMEIWKGAEIWDPGPFPSQKYTYSMGTSAKSGK